MLGLREHMDVLGSMKLFDPAKVDEAEALHHTLSRLYAKVTIDPKEVDKAKRELNHAYTYYKQAADEVKAHGQFVFEGTDRYQAYISDYRQGLGRMADKSPSEPQTQAEPATSM